MRAASRMDSLLVGLLYTDPIDEQRVVLDVGLGAVLLQLVRFCGERVRVHLQADPAVVNAETLQYVGEKIHRIEVVR